MSAPPPNVSKNTTPVPLYKGFQEPIKPALPNTLDTKTPMVREGEVSRFTTADIPKYGPWLLPKLTQRWPQISQMTFSGWVMGWTAGNSFLFV